MIVLDTNVLSELLRPLPSAEVVRWARAQAADAICTTVVCEAELLQGVAFMPEGRRREAMRRAIETILDTVLLGRVLPFDRRAARVYAELAGLIRRRGRPADLADMQIAAIARGHDAAVIATRNVRHFASMGIPIVDPWQAGAAA